MIQVNNLLKLYNAGKPNEIKAVNNVTLDLPDKGLVVLFGKSGSGKTTLLNCIGGLDSVKSGSISIDDTTLSGYDADNWDAVRNSKIGYIFQNYNLISDVSVYRNIEIGLEIAGLTDRKEAKRRIVYALQLVGMEKYKKRLPTALSGGQQQRVGIARALAKAPSVIIADEPTGNLDDKNTLAIMDILKQISKHCLVLLVTHEQRIANYYADRIIEIVDGAVVNDNSSLSKTDLHHKTADKIYLGDLSTQSGEVMDEVKLNYFYDSALPGGVQLKVVYFDGQLYVNADAPNVRVQYLDSNSEVELLDKSYSALKAGEEDNSKVNIDDTVLSPIAFKKHSLFSTRKILLNVYNNWRSVSKKKRTPYVVILTISFILVWLFAFTSSNFLFNPVTQSRRSDAVIKVSQSENSVTLMNYKDYLGLEGSHGISAVIVPPLQLPSYATLVFDFIGADPYGLNGENYFGTGFRIDTVYLPNSLLKSSDILYGRLPQEANEVVIDERSLQRFENGNSGFQSVGIVDRDSLLGITCSVGYNEAFVKDYKVVGISNVKGCYCFVDENELNELVESNSFAYNAPAEYSVEFYCSDVAAAKAYFEGQNMYVYDYGTMEIKEFYRSALSDSVGNFIVTFVVLIIGVLVARKLAHSSFILRIKEIGIMRALGATKKNILKLFFVEGLVYVVLTAFIGMMVPSVFLWYKIAFNQTWRMLFYYPMWLGIALFIFVAGINLLSYISPLLSLSRKTPAEILAKYDI